MTPICGSTVAVRCKPDYWRYLLCGIASVITIYWIYAFALDLGPQARTIIAYMLFILFALYAFREVWKVCGRYQLTEQGIELSQLGKFRERIPWESVTEMRTCNFDNPTRGLDYREMMEKPLDYDSRRSVVLTLSNGREITLETESHLNEFFTLQFISMHCGPECNRSEEFQMFPTR